MSNAPSCVTDRFGFFGANSFENGDPVCHVWTLFVPPGCDRDFVLYVYLPGENRDPACPPTQWLASCPALNIRSLKLAAVDAPAAKLEALHAIGDILANRLKRINSALALMNPDPDATVPLEASPPPPSD